MFTNPSSNRSLGCRFCLCVRTLSVVAYCALNFAEVNVRGAISTFSQDDEGWRITGDAQGSSALPTYHATGGNPGGYISATDNVQGGVWYFKAPDAFHGDSSGAYGAELQFDLRQSGTQNQFNSVDIYLRGAGLELRFDTSYNPGTTWTSYRAPLTEASGWTLGGVAPSQAQMLAVLDNVTDLQIRGEYITGADIGDLDNVYMIAEGLPGDYNQNGSVDSADYVVWRKNEGTTNMLPNDLIGGTIGPAQYDQWRSHFTQTAGSSALADATNPSDAIPEPAALWLVVISGELLHLWRHRRRGDAPLARQM